MYTAKSVWLRTLPYLVSLTMWNTSDLALPHLTQAYCCSCTLQFVLQSRANLKNYHTMVSIIWACIMMVKYGHTKHSSSLSGMCRLVELWGKLCSFSIMRCWFQMKYLINHCEEDENKIYEMFTSVRILVQIFEKILIDGARHCCTGCCFQTAVFQLCQLVVGFV